MEEEEKGRRRKKEGVVPDKNYVAPGVETKFAAAQEIAVQEEDSGHGFWFWFMILSVLGVVVFFGIKLIAR